MTTNCQLGLAFNKYKTDLTDLKLCLMQSLVNDGRGGRIAVYTKFKSFIVKEVVNGIVNGFDCKWFLIYIL